MRINTNIAAIKAIRESDRTSKEINSVGNSLSSGLRINKASDDAAGLSIAADLNVNVRLFQQAVRNINDGISLVSIAEGSYESISNILQRGTELAEQAANGVYSATQKQALQKEAQALVSEIDRITQTTSFNGLSLLSSGSDPNADQKTKIVYGLKASWFRNSEQLIIDHYGLTGDGASLAIEFENDSSSSTLAYVQGQVGSGGKVVNQKMVINLPYFTPADLPNGGTAPFYADRIIAHEMVHAVMGRTMNLVGLPTWFSEGAAEFIHGADERVSGDLTAAGGGSTGANTLAGLVDDTWASNSASYSAGYAAVRYLHARIKGAGGSGIIDVMTYLKNNAGSDLNAALQGISNGAYSAGLGATGTANSFYKDFIADGNGSTFIQAMNLANADTGAIGGADADGGTARTATSVIPDTNSPTDDPLQGFNEVFPVINTNDGTITLAIGKSGSETLAVTLNNTSSTTLGVSGIDLVNRAKSALGNFKSAINTISNERGKLGAFESRLSIAVQFIQNSAENYKGAQSRIEDVDVAEVAGKSARLDILRQAQAAVLSQANSSQEIALQLLRG